RGELPADQVERELPGAPGPARGDREPHRRRPPGLQRCREPLQRLHPPLPPGADGESHRQGAAAVLRAANPGRSTGAEGGFLEVGPLRRCRVSCTMTSEELRRRCPARKGELVWAPRIVERVSRCW